VLWISALLALTSFLFVWVFLAHDRDRAVTSLLERHELTLAVSWEAIQSLQRNSVATYFEEYVLDQRTLEILVAAQDPEQIDQARLDLFRHLSPAYERMVQRGVFQFHFHLPNGDSFLRFHFPTRFGDNLFSIRESIRKANTELEPVFGFELGRLASGLRSVLPILDEQGNHLGSVELSSPFRVLLEELDALMPGRDFELILEADRQREIAFEEEEGLFAEWPASDQFMIEDPYRLRSDSAPPLRAVATELVEQLAGRSDVAELLRDAELPGFHLNLDDRPFVVTRIPVVDPRGERVGFLLSYVEEPELAAIDQFFWIRWILGMLGLAAFFVMLYLMLRALDSRLSERGRLKLISDTMGQGLYLTDAAGKIVSMNPQACQILGYEAQFAAGRSAHDLFHKHGENGFLPETECPMIQGLSEGEEFRGETQFERADGNTIEVSVVSRSIMSNAGGKQRAVGAVTVFEDIGERKQAEAAVRESRQRLANIVWGTGVGTWEWNVQTGETRFNERWAEQLGYKLEELEPTTIATWERLTHPEDLACSEEALQRHFSGETKHYEAEVRVRHRDGRWIWILDRGRVVSWSENGEPEWIVGTHLDITERKVAEQQSTELLERFRKLTVEMPGFVYQFKVSPGGTSSLIYASPGIEKISGLRPSAVVDDATPFLAMWHPDDRDRIQESIETSAAQLTPWSQVFRIITPERGVIWLEGNSTPERLDDGSTVWHGYIHDVSGRREAERLLEESEAKYRNLVENAPVVLFRGEADWPWKMQHVSRSIHRVCGHAPDRFMSGDLNWADIVVPQDLEALRAVRVTATTEHRRYTAEYRIQHLDGSIRWVSEVGALVRQGADEQAVRIEGVISDITDRRQAEQQAQEARLLLQAALESSPSGIVIANASDGSTRFSNPAAEALLAGGLERVMPPAHQEDDKLGWRVLSADGTPLLQEELPLMRAMRSGEVISGFEVIHEYENGDRRWLSVSAAPIADQSGKIDAGIVVFSDISEQKAAQAELRRRAHYDALTDLPNRVLLADRLEQAMTRSRRSGSLLAVAFIDLDNFKPINDEHGHDVGDRLLIEVSKAMRKTLREADTLARLGGDEFIAVLSDLQTVDDAELLLERLIHALSSPIDVDGQTLQVTGSIGMTLYPQAEDLDADQLIRQADQAMYSAKLQGRNRWHFFDGDSHPRGSGGDLKGRPPLQ
jgi:diguanylate cyclase (GGDEF)-like protein/PAS domain S-box-containing protein